MASRKRWRAEGGVRGGEGAMMTGTISRGAIAIVLVTCSMQQVKFPLTYGGELIDGGLELAGWERKTSWPRTTGCPVNVNCNWLPWPLRKFIPYARLTKPID